MIAEEDFIGNKFSDSFNNWVEKTPAFIPSFKNYTKSSVGFSLKTVLRREYSGLLATVVSYVYIDYMRCFLTTNYCSFFRLSTYILLATLIITLILRTLKHNTSCLNEIDRS